MESEAFVYPTILDTIGSNYGSYHPLLTLCKKSLDFPNASQLVVNKTNTMSFASPVI